MKKTVLSSMAIVFLFLVVFACRKSATVNSDDQLLNEILLAGELHNKALTEVSKMTEVDFTNRSKLRQFLIEHNARVQGGDYSDFSFSINDRLINQDLGWVAENAIGSYAGHTARKYITDIGKILSVSSFDQPAISLKEFESLIKEAVSDKALSLKEKGLVLGAASVARHSYIFWRNSSLDNNHPFHKFVKEKRTKKVDGAGLQVAALPDWLNSYIMASDVAGYVGGYNMIMNATDAGCLADPSCEASQVKKAKAYGVMSSEEASFRAATDCCQAAN